MFQTQSLTFSYNGENEFHFPDIQLNSSEHLLILGESGIGKTTLLHLMAGLLSPQSGSVQLEGTILHELPTAKRDQFRGRNIGLVFQRPHFVRLLSLEENLALVQYLAGQPQDKTKALTLLEHLGIGHKRLDKPYSLSQGEQQRASIALAMINSPQLILADEPTASLDDKNCLKVAELLKQQAALSSAQLIIITHDQRLKSLFSNTLQL